MPESIIFYSMKCKYSMKALDIIKKNNININLECIDNNKNLPTFLKVVPTIINKNCDKPLEGNFVFTWLNNFVDKSSTNLNSNNNSNTNTNSMESKDSIQPFFSNEMSGYSDGYSYISNENPMNHSFQFLNNNNVGVEQNNTNNIDRPMSSNNEMNDDFNKKLQHYKEQRDNQLPAPISRR